MLTPLVVAVAAIMAGEVDAPESSATDVIAKWTAAEKDVYAVHATFVRFQYDRAFHVVSHSAGEVHYSSPTDGYWAFAPKDDAPRIVEHGGATYVSQRSRAQRIIWKGDVVTYHDVGFAPGGPDVTYPPLGWLLYLGLISAATAPAAVGVGNCSSGNSPHLP